MIGAVTTGMTMAPGYFSGGPTSVSKDQEQAVSAKANNQQAIRETDQTKQASISQNKELSNEDKRELEKLQARDKEVRAHEAAHKAAAGQYATSGASFEYQTGPDGNKYAVGGEVSIDTSKIPNDPQATLRKAETIRAAATAPADPSSQDRRVAAEASQMAVEARAEIQKQAQEKANQGGVSVAEAYANKPPAGSLFDIHV